MSWRDWPTYSAACRRDVQRLLRDGTSLTAYKANPSQGPGPREGSWAWKLEREAERVHQVPYVVACANGTIALTTLLRVLYPSGGEIITTALTFSATVAAILEAGLTPVFADVEETAGLLDMKSVGRMWTGKTVTALPVEVFGALSWWTGHFPVDACQSVGISSVSNHGVWSFNGRKNVPAGEGGAVFTQDSEIAAQCRLQISHAENFGMAPSGNGHLNELTACVAYHGMTRVRVRNDHRTTMAQHLSQCLHDVPGLTLPDLTSHALYVYPLILDHGMEKVADRLALAGVVCQRGYIQPPLHRYRAFRWFRRDALSVTEALSQDRLLVFPQVTPTATRSEMEQLGEKIRRAIQYL